MFDDLTLSLVTVRGRDYWTDGTGRLVPAVSGGDGPLTLQDLRDDRARGIAAMDAIVETIRSEERDMTDAERADFEYLEAAVTYRDAEIAQAVRAESAEQLLARHEVRRSAGSGSFEVNVNTITLAPPSAERSLDELLWATDDVVRAGTFSDQGIFRANLNGAVNPVEQVIIRSDVDEAGLVAPRIGDFVPEHRSVIRSFQQIVSDMILFGLMVDRDARSSRQGFEAARSHRLFKDRYENILRAMDVDTSGEGGAWVPTGVGASLHERVRAMGKVSALFPRIDLPTNPWKWPIEGADPVAYRVGEPTGNTESKMTASDAGTVAATFDAEIFGGRVLFSRSLEADSALAILPYVTGKLARAHAIAEERAILDGDTDGTHLDSDIGSSTTDAVTAWDGLRKRALANASVATTTTTAANLGTVRKGMGKWGVNPMDCAFIVGVQSYHALLADSNLLTVDKMGPAATILNGQVGSVHGVPVIVSEYVRENLNASGVYDGITATKTYVLCVNRNEWAMGQRMALDVEIDDSIYRETYQRVAIAFQREDFQNIGDASGNDDTSIGFNVTSGS